MHFPIQIFPRRVFQVGSDLETSIFIKCYLKPSSIIHNIFLSNTKTFSQKAYLNLSVLFSPHLFSGIDFSTQFPHETSSQEFHPLFKLTIMPCEGKTAIPQREMMMKRDEKGTKTDFTQCNAYKPPPVVDLHALSGMTIHHTDNERKASVHELIDQWQHIQLHISQFLMSPRIRHLPPVSISFALPGGREPLPEALTFPTLHTYLLETCYLNGGPMPAVVSQVISSPSCLSWGRFTFRQLPTGA